MWKWGQKMTKQDDYFEELPSQNEVEKDDQGIDNKLEGIEQSLKRIETEQEQIQSKMLTYFENERASQEPLVNQADNSAAFESLLTQLSEMDTKHQQEFQRLLRIQEVNINLHKELELYKGGLFEELKLPILKELIRIKSCIQQDLSEMTEDDKFKQLLASYDDDLEILLEDNQLEKISSDLLSDFNKKTDKIHNKIPTNEKALHFKIRDIKEYGYLFNNKVVSRQRVDVYVFEEQALDAE